MTTHTYQIDTKKGMLRILRNGRRIRSMPFDYAHVMGSYWRAQAEHTTGEGTERADRYATLAVALDNLEERGLIR